MPFSPDPTGIDRNAPTVAAGAGLGTAPPAPVVAANSDDNRGTITFGTGTVTGAGTILTVTFSRPKDPNRLPVIMLQESTSATAGVDIAVGVVSSASFTIVTNTRNLAASQAANTYGINYYVID